MRTFKQIVGAAALCAAALHPGASEAASQQAAIPRVFTLDADTLAQAKQRIEAGDAAVLPAYRKLLQTADKALLKRPFSVTEKGVMPPSGDRHDYLSMAPYWWPDPDEADGLPYIRRDGRINPSTKNNDTDAKRLEDFSDAVGALGIGYYFSGDARYAQHAALLLRTWFLDPATRMNPNLKYAQAVMGVVDGRGTGIIDTRHFWQVIDAIGLIAPSGALSKQDEAGLRQWFADYTHWMMTSDNGHREAASRNNHGTYFDEQVVDQALFIGDLPLAQQTLRRALATRTGVQFAADGSQPLELARTRAYHYCTFNLRAWFRMGRFGQLAGVDVWHYPDADHPVLRRALGFLTPYIVDPSAWPYHDIQGIAYADYLPLALQAARVYGPQRGANAALAELHARLPTAPDWLQWPPEGPARVLADGQPGN
jgi:hypothetical protein